MIIIIFALIYFYFFIWTHVDFSYLRFTKLIKSLLINIRLLFWRCYPFIIFISTII